MPLSTPVRAGVALLIALWVLLPCGARSALLINELQSSNVDGLADEDGDHEDWIELLNTGPAAADLTGYGLSDDPLTPLRWTFPALSIAAGERLLVFASGKDRLGTELHTNFSLKSEGEPVLLSDPTGLPVDLYPAQFLPVGISGGRWPDGEAVGYLYDAPTPGAENTGTAYTGIAAAPEISPSGGFYAGGLTATISDPGGQAESIAWTWDGWEPGPDSTAYAGPIPVDGTRVLRARSFETGKLPSPIATRTYIVDDTVTLPVMSVVTDPDHLWDYDTGIYVLGAGNPSFPYEGANFWMDWERPAHVEGMQAGGLADFGLDLGLRIHGNMSRTKPQKSLRLVMRGGYGTRALAEPLFAEQGNPLADFERVLLRNASNDWCIAHLRDGFLQDTVRHLDLDCQGFVPHLVYLNGEYWGIQHLREYMNAHYLEDHHGVDPHNVDILEGQGTVFDIMAGDNETYWPLALFLEDNGLAEPVNYDYVAGQIDVENFATYNIVEIYYGNVDWPRNNRRFWRERTPGARWRWMLIDLDYTLGLLRDAAFDNLDYATTPDGGSQNPPWATLMLRRLLENDGFRADFINRYLDHLNSTFLPGRLLPMLQTEVDRLDPEMDRHMVRWEGSYLGWAYAIEDIEEYLNDRPAHARQHLVDKFGLGDTLTLDLAVSPPHSGQVRLTAVSTDSAWRGLYHQGNPIALSALPAPGWSFAGWSDGSMDAERTISPTGATQLRAEFESNQGPQPRIVINEVNYNSGTLFDPGDWVELYNSGSGDADLGGWIFRDGDDLHGYLFAPGTLLAPGEFALICENRAVFTALFPGADPLPGDLGFGLSGGGEALRLFDADGTLHDTLTYDDAPPWPPEPDGNGPTLELIHPTLDNAAAESWAASSPVTAPHGTPGEQNSRYDATGSPPPAAIGFGLAAPFPNPFNPRTHLDFSLPGKERVRLSVHDIRGRELARLVDGVLDAGHHSREWEGVDDAGRELPAGVYLLRLEAGGESSSRKLVLLK